MQQQAWVYPFPIENEINPHLDQLYIAILSVR